MWVIDTDVISRAMKRRLSDAARARIDALPGDEVAITSITLGELYFGALRSSAAGRWLTAVAALERKTRYLDFDAGAARHYGEIRAHIEARRTRIDDPALRIASICRSRDHVLVSGNEKHFARVPGLRFENWLKR
ncbi:MAG: type II toxin-antitoxin system VapC family toxin [Myxococcota bacterium]